MIRDMLLGIGLLLSTATQLRLGGLPLGPGEFCLVAWLFLNVCRETNRLGPPSTPALKTLLTFWAIFALSMAVGQIVGLATEKIRDPASAQHNVIAYTLMAVVSCFAVVQEAGLHRVARIIVMLGPACLLIQIAHAFGLVNVPNINPWEWTRMRGWSENPNQLALTAAILVVLSIHTVEIATRARDYLYALLCAVVAIAVGVLTKSDSFVVCLALAAMVFLPLKLYAWLQSIGHGLTLRAAFAWILVLAVPVMLASTAPAIPWLAGTADALVSSMYEEKQQGDDRIELWSEGIRRGVGAGFLGLGPGTHIIDKKGELAPPPNFEAHNTLIDIFTQGGLLAVLALLGIAATAFIVACRANLAALPALLCSVFGFGMFHFIFRHPMFWFAIAICLVAGAAARSHASMAEASHRRHARNQPELLASRPRHPAGVRRA
jgi:hypothetical protein